MKISKDTAFWPKSRNAAIRQAAHCSNILDSRRRKEENVMKKREQLKLKISKLQNELSRLEDLMVSLSEDSQTYESHIKDLELQFDFTETEILDCKLQLLRRTLTERQLQEATGIKTEVQIFDNEDEIIDIFN